MVAFKRSSLLLSVCLVFLVTNLSKVEAKGWWRSARDAVVEPVNGMLTTMQAAITKPWRSWSNQEGLGERAPTGSRQRSARVVARSVEMDSQRSAGNETKPAANGEYSTMCLVNRDPPKWKSTLDLHFFSSKGHSKETFGCSNQHVKLQFDMQRFIQTEEEEEEEEAEGNKRNIDDFLKQGTSIRETLLSQSAGYNASQVTYFLTHGFLADWSSDAWMCSVKDMVLNHSDSNVFIVDWSGGSKPMLPIDYGAAVKNTQYVGRLLGAFTQALLEQSNQRDGSNIHLIGHSLGAHICGFIGYSVGSIGRITALDPAGPCFSHSKGNNEAQLALDGQLASGTRRLSMESASLVVALHTDTSLFGLDENCAHFDVYVNGGAHQPDCPSLDLSQKFDDLVHLKLPSSMDFKVTCAHSYAHSLIESIFPSGFGSVIFGLGEQAATGSGKPDDDIMNSDDKEKFARCESLAYRCHSWDAYKSGECGLCEEAGDCIFIGLDSERIKPGAVSEALEGYQEYLNDKQAEQDKIFKGADDFDDEHDSDYNFNEGSNDKKDTNKSDKKDDPDSGRTAEELQIAKDLAKVSRGKHFIKTSDKNPKCLLQYQIIVAIAPDPEIDASKDHYYVQIPMESQSSEEQNYGNRPPERVIRVSHQIVNGSASHLKIEHKLRPQVIVSSDDEQIVYYSALITFKVATDCDSRHNKKNPDNDEFGVWSLCEPLQGLKEANVWSSDTKNLAAIRWVAVNYMSAVSKAERRKFSRILVPDVNKRVVSRRDTKEALRPSLRDLKEPEDLTNSADPMLLVNSVLNRALVQPTKCIVSSIDPSQPGRSKNNIRCMRSAEEMKYSIVLRAIETQAKS